MSDTLKRICWVISGAVVYRTVSEVSMCCIGDVLYVLRTVHVLQHYRTAWQEHDMIVSKACVDQS